MPKALGRSSVVATVERLQRQRAWVTRCLAAFVALAAALCVHAAALRSGVEPFATDSWIASGVAALAVGAAWIRSHRISGRDLARLLDQRVGAEGALESAWECERRGGRLAPALIARGLKACSGHALRELACPDARLAVLAPLASAALLAVAVEAQPEEPRPDFERIAQDLVGSIDLAGAQSREGRLDDAAPERRLRELAARAEQLAQAAASAPELGADQLAEARAIAQELQRLADESAPDADWRRALDAARNAAEMLLEGDPEAAPSAGGEGLGPASEPEDGGSGGSRGGLAQGPVEPLGPGGDGPSAPRDLGPEPPGAPALDLAPADAAFLGAWARALDEVRRGNDR